MATYENAEGDHLPRLYPCQQVVVTEKDCFEILNGHNNLTKGSST